MIKFKKSSFGLICCFQNKIVIHEIPLKALINLSTPACSFQLVFSVFDGILLVYCWARRTNRPSTKQTCSDHHHHIYILPAVSGKANRKTSDNGDALPPLPFPSSLACENYLCASCTVVTPAQNSSFYFSLSAPPRRSPRPSTFPGDFISPISNWIKSQFSMPRVTSCYKIPHLIQTHIKKLAEWTK